MGNKRKAERGTFSPQEKSILQYLLAAPDRQAPVEALFRALNCASVPGDRAYAMQRVGSVVSTANAKLKKWGRPEVVKPGTIPGTYRIWPNAAAAEKGRLARATQR